MPKKLTALLFLGCLPVAAQTRPPAGMPKVMQVCVAVCATLEWSNGRYQVLSNDGIPSITYTVESFTPKSVVMHRTELANNPAYGLTAVYTGTFEDGATSAHGTVDFKWPGHQGFPHSGTWKATWGASLATAAQPKPEERGEAEEVQARAAQDEQARTLSAGILGFFAAMLGAGPGGGENGGGNGDPSGRIARLQGHLDELSSECARDPRDANGACGKAQDLRGELDDAYAALNQEIETLKPQVARLQKDCAAHVAGACANLNRVKERLEGDVETRLGGIF
jgi:hypothetical protein